MDWKNLDSGHVKAAAYDEESATLYVQFHQGRRYAYGRGGEGVPKKVADQLFSQTGNVGSFFRTQILRYWNGEEVTEE